MDTHDTLIQQIAREITGTREFLIRRQRPMPGPAPYNHPAIPATWDLVITSDVAEISQYEAMAPANVTQAATEAEFFTQYANQYRLDPVQYNTSPAIVLTPAPCIKI